MTLYLLVFVVLAVVGLLILYSMSYLSDQQIICPFCGHDFPADLILLRGYAVVQCPFCRHWSAVSKRREEYAVNRLF